MLKMRLIINTVCHTFMTLYLLDNGPSVTYGAPQGSSLKADVFSDVFQCADLESSGYECTPKSKCVDGYIDDTVITDYLGERFANENYNEYESFDASSYECSDDLSVDPRLDSDYESDSSDGNLVCCRKPEFFNTPSIPPGQQDGGGDARGVHGGTGCGLLPCSSTP